MGAGPGRGGGAGFGRLGLGGSFWAGSWGGGLWGGVGLVTVSILVFSGSSLSATFLVSETVLLPVLVNLPWIG